MAIALFVFINLFCCAKQGFPPGGSDDKTPPYVSESVPAQGEIKVASGNTVTLVFSESMNTESVEQNLFIVPLPSVWPEYQWKSKNRIATIKFKESFRENTTYVLTLGTKSLDTHNNTMKNSFVLTFSTGDTIENRKITGKVIPYNYLEEKKEDTSGIDVIAYILKDENSAPDPGKDVPDFFTQTGSDGFYELIGLSKNKYRVFAIGDRDKNGFYSEGSDMIGFSPADITFSAGDSLSEAPDIVITKPDTGSVQLYSVRASDSRRIELSFNRPVLSDSFSVSVKGLGVTGWFFQKNTPSSVSVVTDKQEKGTKYSIDNIKAVDKDGNKFGSLLNIPPFEGSDKPDTTALLITEKTPAVLTPGAAALKLIFNRALEITGNAGDIITHNSLTPVTVEKKGSNIIEISTDWKGGYTYDFKFDTEKIKGVSGNVLSGPDSQLNFRVVSEDTLGYIQGIIKDKDLKENSVYNIIFKNLESGVLKNIVVKGIEEWKSGPVLPGKYIYMCYRDNDGDGKLFSGTLHPLRLPEKVVLCADTIEVASRWTNEGNSIIFK